MRHPMTLGIFLPLIVTNCLLLARAESFASRRPLLPAILDGLVMGFGFMWVLLLLGMMRELLGQGSLFASPPALLADIFPVAGWQWFDGSFLLPALPAGAFVLLGFILAAKNAIDQARLVTIEGSRT